MAEINLIDEYFSSFNISKISKVTNRNKTTADLEYNIWKIVNNKIMPEIKNNNLLNLYFLVLKYNYLYPSIEYIKREYLKDSKIIKYINKQFRLLCNEFNKSIASTIEFHDRVIHYKDFEFNFNSIPKRNHDYISRFTPEEQLLLLLQYLSNETSIILSEEIYENLYTKYNIRNEAFSPILHSGFVDRKDVKLYSVQEYTKSFGYSGDFLKNTTTGDRWLIVPPIIREVINKTIDMVTNIINNEGIVFLLIPTNYYYSIIDDSTIVKYKEYINSRNNPMVFLILSKTTLNIDGINYITKNINL